MNNLHAEALTPLRYKSFRKSLTRISVVYRDAGIILGKIDKNTVLFRFFGKGMLDGVGHNLVNNECTGHCRFKINLYLFTLNLKSNRVHRRSYAGNQVCPELTNIIHKTETGNCLSRVKLIVYQCHSEDALAHIFHYLPKLRIFYSCHLQRKQADDNVHVVLSTVVDLPQKDILLFLRTSALSHIYSGTQDSFYFSL